MREDVARKFRKINRRLDLLFNKLDELVLAIDDKAAAKVLADKVRADTQALANAIPK